MKRHVFFTVTVYCLMLSFSLAPVAAFELITRDVIQKEIITEVDLIKTSDNIIILFDGSSSTNRMVPGTNISRIAAAKAFLKERNQWLPDLGYRCGLYLLSGMTTLKTIHEVQPYDRQALDSAIDKLPDKGAGNSLLLQALFRLEKIVASLTGRTAVVLFTDGEFTQVSDPRKPVDVARSIARDHDVNFYVISSAELDTQKAMLERVASINAGSRVIPIQAFMLYPEYLSGALFVARVSSYVKLTSRPEVVGFVTENLLFGSNSEAINTQYHQKLELLGRFLEENPSSYVVLQGFSDSTGSAEQNLALSQARAMAVGQYLVDNFGIDPVRIVPLWYGDLNPAADNGSVQGRQLNRRVEIAVGILD